MMTVLPFSHAYIDLTLVLYMLRIAACEEGVWKSVCVRKVLATEAPSSLIHRFDAPQMPESVGTSDEGASNRWICVESMHLCRVRLIDVYNESVSNR